MSELADMLRDALLHIASYGAAGGAFFILFYALCCVLFMPVSVLTLGAGAVYGLGPGFGLVWAGATVGACASFLLGRHWLRAWVEKRLAAHPLFLAIDAAVSVEGWKVVFLTRLTPLFPFALQNYAYGVTRVKFLEYAWASFLGMAPGTLMFVYFGAIAGEAVKAGAARTRTPLERAFYGVGLLATIVVVAIVSRAAKRALKTRVKLPKP